METTVLPPSPAPHLPALAAPPMERVIIRAGKVESQYWKDIFLYREVLLFLAWRDILVRYKQAFFGVSWAVIRPLLTMLIFSFVFGRLARMPSGGMPYSLMVFSGLWPWLFFSTAALESSNSLIANQNLVSKVYFPRLLVPLGSIVAAVVDFIFASVVLIGIMIFFKVAPTWRLFTLPLFFSLAFVTAAAVGIWFSALNVKYRDFRFIMPVFLQLGLYLSPVGFAAKVVPEKFQLIYSMNPMVGVIQGFRWAIYGQQACDIYWPGFAISIGLVAVMLFGGLRHFRSTEKTMADFL